MDFLVIIAILLAGLVVLVGVIAAMGGGRWLLRGFFRAFLPLFRVEVTGAEHLRSQGPAVYVSNHVSLLDGPLLLALIGRRLEIAIDSGWAAHPLMRLLRRPLSIFPIDPQRPMSAKVLARRVAEGGACLIFPEGRVSRTGGPMKLNQGAAWLVDQGRAEVISIHIEGLERSRLAKPGTGWRRIWLPKVRVHVSAPQRLEVDAELRGKRRRVAVLSSLRGIMDRSRFDALHRHRNLLEAIHEAGRIHGMKRVAFEDALGTGLSYRQILLGSAVLARLLERRITPGARVGLLLPTAPGAVVVMTALWRIGVVPAVINHTVGAASVKGGLGRLGAETIVSSRAFVKGGRLDALIAELEGLGLRFIWVEDLREGITLADKLAGLLGANRLPEGIDRDTGAAVLFTSGSEGVPKAVMLSHGNILANCAQLRARTDIGPRDVSLSALPVFHSFGLTAGIILPMICGIRTGLHPSPLHYRIIPEFAYNLQATLVFGTDTFLAGWARRADPLDFSSLRAAIAGAEPVKPATRKVWSDNFGVRILEGYGATECGPVLSLGTPAEPAIGSVGRLLPGIEMRLEPVPGIEGARMMVRGPNIMAGYVNNAEVEHLPDGWYDTGDMVRLDEQGFIHIVGRLKRFAKVGGEMVSLQAVENLAAEVWPGTALGALNLPHPRTGEHVVLYVAQPDARLADLTAHAKAKGVGSVLLPARLEVVDAIPLLASGKTDYPALRARVEADRAPS